MYVTLDIDAVDPAFAPGTDTPELAASAVARSSSPFADWPRSRYSASTWSRSLRRTMKAK